MFDFSFCKWKYKEEYTLNEVKVAITFVCLSMSEIQRTVGRVGMEWWTLGTETDCAGGS